MIGSHASAQPQKAIALLTLVCLLSMNRSMSTHETRGDLYLKVFFFFFFFTVEVVYTVQDVLIYSYFSREAWFQQFGTIGPRQDGDLGPNLMMVCKCVFIPTIQTV